MNIDERLDRLTERHEALAQSVELMAAENRQWFAETQQIFSTVLDSIKRLEHIAEIHEHRIGDLEGQQ